MLWRQWIDLSQGETYEHFSRIETTATFKRSNVALKSLSWDPAAAGQKDNTYWLNGEQYSRIDSAAWSQIELGKAKL